MFGQINSSAKAEDVVGRLNYNIKGRELKSGDLKTAARTVLPGLVGKMQQDMKSDMDMMSRKEKVQSFTKVPHTCNLFCLLHMAL